MPAISVIMPVYNSERYLASAIDSVLNQTFSDFELLLINDGSKDSSGDICDGYAARDSRVKVLHRDNGGICVARNTGLDMATGEYIAFIDNDDEYSNNLLMENYELLRENGWPDIVKYGYHVTETFEKRASDERDTCADRLTIIPSEDLAINYMNAKKSGFFNMIWNGLYRREFMTQNNLRFDVSIKFGYEDWAFNYTIYPLACKIILNPGIYYIHLQRTGVSTSKKFYIERPYGCISAATKEKVLFDKLGLDNIFPFYWSELLIKYLIEILVLFQYPDCKMKIGGKVVFLTDLKAGGLFAGGISPEDSKHLFLTSKTKSAVKSLFYGNHYKTLLFLSKIYYYYLDLKRM